MSDAVERLTEWLDLRDKPQAALMSDDYIHALVWDKAPGDTIMDDDLRTLLSDLARMKARVADLEKCTLSGAWVIPGPNMRWAQVQRLRFIGHLIETKGTVNRAEIMQKFGISAPQASVDLREFQRWNPDRLLYDPSRKWYVAARLALRQHEDGR